MKWAGWLSALSGLWVLISPWVMDYSNNTGATWSSVISGVVISLFSILAVTRVLAPK